MATKLNAITEENARPPASKQEMQTTTWENLQNDAKRFEGK